PSAADAAPSAADAAPSAADAAPPAADAVPSAAAPPEPNTDGDGHGHGHLHLLRHGPPMSRRAIRFAVAVLVVAAFGSIVGMVLLWPAAKPKPSVPDGGGATQVTGVVESVQQVSCPPADDEAA